MRAFDGQAFLQRPHLHPGPERHAIVKVDDVLVEQPDAACAGGIADGRTVRRAVDAEHRVAPVAVQIQRPRPQRVLQPARQPAGKGRVKVGPGADHVRRGGPRRPVRLAPDNARAAERQPIAPDRDGIAHRGAALFHQVQLSAVDIDHDGPRRVIAGIGHLRAAVAVEKELRRHGFDEEFPVLNPFVSRDDGRPVGAGGSAAGGKQWQRKDQGDPGKGRGHLADSQSRATGATLRHANRAPSTLNP